MMKSGELLVVVDSVEEAVKFYTEKLAFDIVDARRSTDNPNLLGHAQLKKGKSFIIFKQPSVEELAEFSFIKRCASRCTGLYMEMKKGLDRYFQRCSKKGVKILAEPKIIDGIKTFSMKDPFGIKILVAEVPGKTARKASFDFLGLKLSERDVLEKARKENDIVFDMIDQLKSFGILRRAGKKYAKQYLKRLVQKK